MSEEIVTCPGCAKKFRIPDGAAPSGSFPCTACGGDVRYGAAPAKPAAGAGQRKSGKRRPKRPAATSSARPAGGGRRGAAAEAGAGRQAPLRPVRQNNTAAIVAAIMGGLVIVVVAVVLIAGRGKDKTADPTETGGTGGESTSTHTISNDGDNPPEPAPVEPPPVETSAEAGTGDADKPKPWETQPKDTGIGGAQNTAEGEMDYGQYFRLSDEELLVRVPSVDGVSEQERAEIDHQVALLTDRNSGRDGMVAIDWLVKRKKRAMPSLLSWFEGKTFDNEEQQWAAHQVQQVLRDIVKAEPMPSDLFARFNPGMTTPKEHFRRAAKMWVAQWNAVLSKKETFQGYDEEE